MSNYIPVYKMRENEIRTMLANWAAQLRINGVAYVNFLGQSHSVSFVQFHHPDSRSYLKLEVLFGAIQATWTDARTGRHITVRKTLVDEALREIMDASAEFR